MGWGVCELTYRREENSVSYQDVVSPLGMGTERECEKRLQQVVCFRGENEPGDWIWRRGGIVKS